MSDEAIRNKDICIQNHEALHKYLVISVMDIASGRILNRGKTSHGSWSLKICSDKVGTLTCFFFLISWGIGRENRVPNGSICLCIRTTVLSWNLISLLSHHPHTPLHQKTTCPFFTSPQGCASFIVVMLSLNHASLLPLKACLHITNFAPELSTTSIFVLTSTKVIFATTLQIQLVLVHLEFVHNKMFLPWIFFTD